MEHEIMMTGVGGQGVQLAAQILARSAVVEQREVMTLGTYGGTMRGGNTDSTLVVADGPIHSPPIVAEVGIALAMHHAFFEPVAKKLRPGALIVVNSTIFEEKVQAEDASCIEFPATRIATDLGVGMAASLVLIAAFAKYTGFVSLDSLVAGMEQSVPSYRSQHVEGNAKALRAGYDAIEPGGTPAWPGTGGAS
jgi:Pyruvate/2-oxoacid:ferredoxin oxidoreductase gamma subunit